MLERKISTPRPGKFLQRDRRADEGKRQVQLTGDDIMISRRLAGIRMMISVPVSSYRGVALDVDACEQGGASYRISLAHADPDLDVILAETHDSGAIAADWRYWATFLGLPRLWSRDGGAEPAPAAIASTTSPRRRNASVRKRRPHFLARRKLGDLTRASAVFAGEREIICYE